MSNWVGTDDVTVTVIGSLIFFLSKLGEQLTAGAGTTGATPGYRES